VQLRWKTPRGQTPHNDATALKIDQTLHLTSENAVDKRPAKIFPGQATRWALR
jgi:hypothetical protein